MNWRYPIGYSEFINFNLGFLMKNTLEIRTKTIFDGFFVKYLLKLFFWVVFKLLGWRPTPTTPCGAGVTIAAPHTSNWDFFYALGAAILCDVKIYFSIKESWCRIPVVGQMVMWMGAIPIDRSAGGQGQVEKIKRFVMENKQQGRIYFLFTPEGTRGKVERWKTGFYHIAEACKLPIFLSKVDFSEKEAGVFHTYELTGDKTDDINAIQASYKTIQGRFSENQYPPYEGPMPSISEAEARILKALYSFKGAATSRGAVVKGVATRVEISAKAKMEEISANMMEYLIEKGVLEKVDSGNLDSGNSDVALTKRETLFQLTFAGRGCLLHLYPKLA